MRNGPIRGWSSSMACVAPTYTIAIFAPQRRSAPAGATPTNAAPTCRQARRPALTVRRCTPLAFHLRRVCMIAARGCVRLPIQGPQPIGVPAAVRRRSTSGLNLHVGDQKGGTEALLRDAHALDGLPVPASNSPR